LLSSLSLCLVSSSMERWLIAIAFSFLPTSQSFYERINYWHFVFENFNAILVLMSTSIKFSVNSPVTSIDILTTGSALCETASFFDKTAASSPTRSFC
jgi:hypothetical protein